MNSVAELDIPVKFEFSGKEFTEGFNKQINSLTRDYRKLVKNIQSSAGVDKSLAETVAKSLIGKGVTYKLIEQNIKSKKVKSWTTSQLLAKESKFQELNQLYTKKGYNEGLKTIFFNKELGEGFYQERKKKAQDVEEIKIQKQKNKANRESIKQTDKLNDSFKSFNKGVFGNMTASKMVTTGILGAVGTVVGFLGKSVIDASTHRFENEARFGKRGARQVTGIERIMGILGGSYLSSTEAKELGATSARYIEAQTQDVTGIGSNIGNLAMRLGGRGSKYYGKYAQLLVKGYKTGEPEYEEMYKLAEEIAKDKKLSQTDKATFLKQITGSEEIAQTMLTALLAGKSFTTGEYADYVKKTQDVGLVSGKESKLLGYTSRYGVEKGITTSTIWADNIVVRKESKESKNGIQGNIKKAKETFSTLPEKEKKALTEKIQDMSWAGRVMMKNLLGIDANLGAPQTEVKVYNTGDIKTRVEVTTKNSNVTTSKSQGVNQ